MKTLEEFERQNPKIWSNPSSGLIIAYALFHNDKENKGITKRDLKEIPSIYPSEISEGIQNLENTEEIISEKRIFHRKKYFLGKELRETMNKFYS